MPTIPNVIQAPEEDQIRRGLFDGRTARQHVEPGGAEYVSVASESHDLIYADGAMAETYIDYPPASEFMLTEGCPPGSGWTSSVPRVDEGLLLDGIRESVRRRTSAGQIRFNGVIDSVSREAVHGWALDLAKPDEPQRLSVRVDGITVGEASAGLHRGDLAEAGLPSSRCAFAFDFPGGLPPARTSRVEVILIPIGTQLVGSPVKTTIGPADGNRPSPSAPALSGVLDNASRSSVIGWASEGHAGAPVELQVVADGVLRASILANHHRPDLVAAIGNGWRGFGIRLRADSLHPCRFRRDGRSTACHRLRRMQGPTPRQIRRGRPQK